MIKTWYVRYKNKLSFGQRLADAVAAGMGSWKFIIAQTIIICIWVFINVYVCIYRWDPYPFILLNLLFSIQAAYAAPIIIMSQNRQSQRDRENAENDYIINKESRKEIEKVMSRLNSIDSEKLDQIIKLLNNLNKK